jgi:hypothetical protein
LLYLAYHMYLRLREKGRISNGYIPISETFEEFRLPTR